MGLFAKSFRAFALAEAERAREMKSRWQAILDLVDTTPVDEGLRKTLYAKKRKSKKEEARQNDESWTTRSAVSRKCPIRRP